MLHLIVDSNGLPLWITSTSAKGNEREQAINLVSHFNAIHKKNNKTMTICEADKGYDSDEFRQELLYLRCVPIIGYRKHRKETTKMISDFFDVTRKRWVVERTFSWLKRKCRRLMARWERLPLIWSSFGLLGLIYMWLEYLLG